MKIQNLEFICIFNISLFLIPLTSLIFLTPSLSLLIPSKKLRNNYDFSWYISMFSISRIRNFIREGVWQALHVLYFIIWLKLFIILDTLIIMLIWWQPIFSSTKYRVLYTYLMHQILLLKYHYPFCLFTWFFHSDRQRKWFSLKYSYSSYHFPDQMFQRWLTISRKCLKPVAGS